MPLKENRCSGSGAGACDVHSASISGLSGSAAGGETAAIFERRGSYPSHRDTTHTSEPDDVTAASTILYKFYGRDDLAKRVSIEQLVSMERIVREIQSGASSTSEYVLEEPGRCVDKRFYSEESRCGAEHRPPARHIRREAHPAVAVAADDAPAAAAPQPQRLAPPQQSHAAPISLPLQCKPGGQSLVLRSCGRKRQHVPQSQRRRPGARS